MNIRINFLAIMAMLVPGALQADMLFSMMDYQGPTMQPVVLTKTEKSGIKAAAGVAAIAGIYQYGKNAGYKKVLRELEEVKAQNKITHAELEKVNQKANHHGTLLEGIKNKQMDHSYELNRIRQTVDTIETKVDTTNTKLDLVHDKTTVLESKATAIENQVAKTNSALNKLQGTVNAQHARHVRQTATTHNMLRGMAQILGIMHTESRSDSRQILSALGEYMANSKMIRLLMRR